MTKEQVIEKFKEFQDSVEEYDKLDEKNPDGSSKLGVFAVIGATDEQNTGVKSNAVAIGTLGVIENSLQKVLSNEDIRKVLLSALAKSSFGRLSDLLSKEKIEPVKA